MAGYQCHQRHSADASASSYLYRDRVMHAQRRWLRATGSTVQRGRPNQRKPQFSARSGLEMKVAKCGKLAGETR